MKIAIIHDWLVTRAGAEKVLEHLLFCFPNADLFSVVDFYNEVDRSKLLNKNSFTTFIQKIPFAKTKYRSYLPLMPLAIEQLDLSAYDLVISSSHAVAKGVLTGPNQLHISYVHSPIRYAWDLQHQYLAESNLNNGIIGIFARLILHYIRIWDLRTSFSVDYYIANSKFIQRRISKFYNRNSTVIYPPVNIKNFNLYDGKREEYYFTASRFVPYKKLGLIIEAFSKIPTKKLVVIGDGPDFNKCKAQATNNIELLGWQPDNILIEYMKRAKCFVFAAEEDFGITPVEAQACGTPVIAFGRGGALETVNGLDSSSPTGVFFESQDYDSLLLAISTFESHQHLITPHNCRAKAELFSENLFRENIKKFVEEKYAQHRINL